MAGPLGRPTSDQTPSETFRPVTVTSFVAGPAR
jgi:hypothetical protein